MNKTATTIKTSRDAVKEAMARFAPNREASTEESSTATVTTAAPATPAAAPPAASDVVTITDQTTAAAAEGSTETSDASEEGFELSDILPKEALSKRALNHLRKQVNSWEAPPSLGLVAQRRYREMAFRARVGKLMDVATKFQLGRFFNEAKQQLGYGHWKTYIEEAADLSPRSASRYMAVADTFPDARVVVMMSFEWCLEVAMAKPPKALIQQIVDAQTANEAENLFNAWKQDQQIANAFLGLLPPDKTAEKLFGRDLAVALSVPNVVRDLRIFACELADAALAAEVLSEYHHELGTSGMDASSVVRELRRRRTTGTATTAAAADATGTSSSAPVLPRLNLRNLETRLQVLRDYDNRPLDADAEQLARSIEEQLLRLTQLIQAQS